MIDQNLLAAQKRLAYFKKKKRLHIAELLVANSRLVSLNDEIEKMASELLIAKSKIKSKAQEKDKQVKGFLTAKKRLATLIKDKEKRAFELSEVNKKLIVTLDEIEKIATELLFANKELVFQNEEKSKRATKLLITKKELTFQNEEKAKRAAELVIANKELAFQNEEKTNRASELVIVNKELKYERIVAQMYLDVAGIMFLVLDINGDITLINKRGCEILELEEKDIIGKNWFDNFLPKDIAKTVKKFFESVFNKETEMGTNYENAVIAASGKEKIMNWYNTVIYDIDNNAVGVLSSGEDVTEKRQTESALRESNEKYIAIFDQSPIAIEFYDANGILLHANEACIQLFGVINRIEIFGFKLFDNPNLSFEVKTKIANHEKVFVESEFSFEEVKRLHLYQTSCSGTKIFSLSISPLMNENTLNGYVVQTEDITFRKQKQNEIQYLNNHDYLTDLFNRRYFFEQLNQFDHADCYPLGIMMIDVNGLKIFNDAYGHSMGDIVLKTVGNLLKNIFEKKDVVARIGGDEFAVLIPNTTMGKMQEEKDKLRLEVEKYPIKNAILSLAIGYDEKKNLKTSLDEVLKLAENHMYKHKISEGSSSRSRTISAILATLTDKFDAEKTHSERVSQYCKEIGKELKLRKEEITALEMAGMFHDIGKISIPDEILNKPGKLTNEEYEIIKTHPLVGYQILRAADEYSDLAIHALHHHERWDGKGYPKGLRGKDIPLFSRIIGVVDAYEVMTADRPYRNKMSEEYAISEIIRCSGTQFDPKIAKLFVEKVLQTN